MSEFLSGKRFAPLEPRNYGTRRAGWQWQNAGFTTIITPLSPAYNVTAQMRCVVPRPSVRQPNGACFAIRFSSFKVIDVAVLEDSSGTRRIFLQTNDS